MGSFRRKRSCVKHGPPVPLLRGYFHVVGTYITVAMLPVLVILVPGKLAKIGIALATGIKAFLLLVSAIAHTTEFQTMKIHDRVFAVDHANIFICIATNITALHSCRCEAHMPLWPLITTWICTYILVLKLMYVGRTMNKGVQVALGVTMIALAVNTSTNLNLSPKQIVLYIMVFVLGVVGSLVWALEAPNPIKGVLEFHEVLHIFSLVYLGVETLLFLDAAISK